MKMQHQISESNRRVALFFACLAGVLLGLLLVALGYI